ncbi:hypothetical protein ACI2KR_08930 [Pseudomonas luteola]
MSYIIGSTFQKFQNFTKPLKTRFVFDTEHRMIVSAQSEREGRYFEIPEDMICELEASALCMDAKQIVIKYEFSKLPNWALTKFSQVCVLQGEHALSIPLSDIETDVELELLTDPQFQTGFNPAIVIGLINLLKQLRGDISGLFIEFTETNGDTYSIPIISVEANAKMQAALLPDEQEEFTPSLVQALIIQIKDLLVMANSAAKPV